MLVGGTVMGIGAYLILKESYWGGLVIGAGASLYSKGYDLYKNKDSKNIIWCGTESSGSSPYCMYINSDLGLGGSSEPGNGSNGYEIPNIYY